MLVVCIATAQTHHFIYIESQNKKPFTTKVNGIAFETDHKQFITISKLENGVYYFTISTENAKENKFTISLDGEDLGDQLKQDTTGDFFLLDINRFTMVLQDGKIAPIIKQEIIVKKETVITKKNDSAIASTPKKIVVPIEEIAASSKSNDKKVRKIFNKRTNAGIDQIYVDASGKTIDTIAIFIPWYTMPAKDTIKEAKPQLVKEQTMQSKNIDMAPSNNCIVVASEKDVANFSMKLQAAPILKSKLKIASVILNEKCYTVNQIKRLSVLMINDSGKINFFKLAQKNVSDARNFSSLENEIKDESLKQEFKALINSQ
jgi:hypothetical protein